MSLKPLPPEYRETFRQEWVRCGRENCHCAKDDKHGPYWYGYTHWASGFHKRYIGKKLPGQEREEK